MKLNNTLSDKTYLLIIYVCKAIFTSTSVLVIGKVIQFILLLYLANYLGPKYFTFLASSLVYAQLLSLIIIPGGQQGLTASIARALAGNNQMLCKSILLHSTYILFFFITLIIIFLIFLSHFFITSLDYQYGLITLITLFTIFRTSITRGYGFIFISLFFSEILAPLFLLFCIFFTNKNFPLSFPMTWFLTYAFFEMIVIILSKKIVFKTLKYRSLALTSSLEVFKDTFLIQIANILQIIITRIDMVILSFVAGPIVAAPYALAQKFVQPITILVRALSNSTSPMLTTFYESGDRKNLKYVNTLNFIFVLVGSIVVILGLYSMYDFIIGYLSPEYNLDKSMIYYLTGSQLCLVISAPFVLNLLMTKKAHWIILTNIISCMIFIMIIIINYDQLNGLNMAKYSFVATLFMSIMSMYFSIRASQKKL
jgi:O-antigen/teichoic acid export membrane protein